MTAKNVRKNGSLRAPIRGMLEPPWVTSTSI